MHGHGHGMHAWIWMMEKPLPAELVKELKLSAEQVQKIEVLAENLRTAALPQETALKEAHEALKKALEEPSPNEEEVMLRLSLASAASLELRKSQTRFMLALRQELGPELWEKLKSEKFHKGRKGMKGKHGKPLPQSLCVED
ncbi:MAG: hypothetical protein FWG75_05965 [Cystobacterineae bacterium]|nr:hypothetical protein [Cystobacterineae bacterium]